MKKIATTFALLFVLVLTAFAEHVETSEARKAAETFLQSKMNVPMEIRLIDYEDQDVLPNFYVFGNDRCFVIIAADNAVHPVLGYSTENAFGEKKAPENVLTWLKDYNDEIGYVVGCRMQASSEIQSEWDNLLNGKALEPKTRSSVSPLVRTYWDQSEPFNNACPSNGSGTAVTGCVATAMAQVMNYWEHPARGTGSHSYWHSTFGQLSANFGNTVYDWDHMKNGYITGYTNTEANAVATLMYHCGVAVEMNYGINSSGASSSDVPDALMTYFGYSSEMFLSYKNSYTNAQWINMLKTELNNGRPVYYSGRSSSSGHAFVCDGYDESDYFHFNWGWGGSRDGYYAMGALNPGGGGTGSGSGQYNIDNMAIFGCQPNTPSINPPTISASVNGRNVSLSWNSVSNAVSYKLYRDGDLVATSLTSTSYTDNNVTYGDHAYYVKSVKSDGTMSLKSNTATVNVHFEGPVATNLQYSLSGNNVHLSWTAPASESAVLQYGTGDPWNSVGYNNGSTPFYWAQRYPASILASYAGMAINKVSVYFQNTGSYTLYIYKGNEAGTTDLVFQISYTASGTGWKDINFASPVPVDYTKDLWVVMYAPASISYPACYGNYTGSGVENAAYYSSTGSAWYQWGDNEYSWAMKTYITDGTYTYNIYRNGSSVATNVSNTYYNNNGVPNGSYTYYVKTNYYGGESDASNSVNVNVGSPGSGITQTTDFGAGWTWWSTYVEQNDATGLTQLETGLGDNGQLIKSQTASVSNIGGGEWYGTLTALDNALTYRVKTTAAKTVSVTGQAVATASHPVTLNPNWTWIGYPSTTSMTVAQVMSGITPMENDVLKSQSGSATYMYGDWYGALALSPLTPGMGLMYKSNRSTSITLTFPSGAKGEGIPELEPVSTHWAANYTAYPDNMTVMALVEMDGEELQGERYELAAFANGECRGSVPLLYIAPLNRYVAILTVSGDEAAELYFGLYDTETGEEYFDAEETATYQTNAVVGSVDELFTFHFRGTTSLDEQLGSQFKVFPNPVERGQMVSLGFAAEGIGEAQIIVIDALGTVVETYRGVSLQAPNIPGVYTLRISLGDKGTCCRKLVVK